MLALFDCRGLRSVQRIKELSYLLLIRVTVELVEVELDVVVVVFLTLCACALATEKISPRVIVKR